MIGWEIAGWSIACQVEHDWIELTYRQGGEFVSERITVDTTTTQFGGRTSCSFLANPRPAGSCLFNVASDWVGCCAITHQEVA